METSIDALARSEDIMLAMKTLQGKCGSILAHLMGVTCVQGMAFGSPAHTFCHESIKLPSNQVSQSCAHHFVLSHGQQVHDDKHKLVPLECSAGASPAPPVVPEEKRMLVTS